MFSTEPYLSFLCSKIPGDTSGYWASKLLKFYRTRCLAFSFLFLFLILLEQLTDLQASENEFANQSKDLQFFKINQMPLLIRQIYLMVIFAWLLVCFFALKY